MGSLASFAPDGLGNVASVDGIRKEAPSEGTQARRHRLRALRVALPAGR